MFNTFPHDVRHALRVFRREPGFSLASLLTLALGIGATTAMFTVVNAVLLQAPPYPAPQRILALAYPDGGSQTGAMFHYVRERARAFETIAAHSGSSGWNVVAGRNALYAPGLPVSRGFFDVLGVRPQLGRGFSADEDRDGGPRAVVLSEGLWRRILDGRREAIGETILLGGVPHSVIGVMPAGFKTIPAADLWTPLRLSRQDNSSNYTVVGRLSPGVPAAQANAELDRLRAGIRQELPDMSERRSRGLVWMSYQERLGLNDRLPLLMLLAAVGFLLLIACVNVASLQLVRALARGREMATRAALGAGRGALVRQVLTESVVLAGAGGALGLLLTRWGIGAVTALVPAGLLADHPIAVDWHVLLVTLAIAIGVGVLFGMTPAVAAARVDVRAALWEGSHQTASRRTIWLRRSFNVLEMALAGVLLVGAGLMIRTFVNLRSTDPGFDSRNVVVARMSLQGSSRQGNEAASVLIPRTLDRLRLLPGVAAVAVGSNVPIERALNMPLAAPPGSLVTDIRAVDWLYITPDYFQVFGIRLREGRGFTDRDDAASSPVALVNEAFARSYFGRQAAVGRQVELVREFKDRPREVVGVVADVKGVSGSGWTRGASALGSPVAPAVYVPLAQVPEPLLDMIHHFYPIGWAVRTRGPVPSITRDIEDAVRATAPTLPLIGCQTMDDLMARDLAMQRFLMTLLTLFGAAALALASVGMYGLVAYTTTTRSREIAIRMAVGATRAQVARAFVQEGGVLALLGAGLGLAGAALATRVLASFVLGVTALDPATFIAGGGLLIAIALLASIVPAVRAARVDPSTTLHA